jgi:predicted nucleic acid-binding protein
LWRATLRRAGELSRTYAPTMGCRALDILHVATALELGLRYFVTFDRRQQHLAQATGLKLVAVGAPSALRSS